MFGVADVNAGEVSVVFGGEGGGFWGGDFGEEVRLLIGSWDVSGLDASCLDFGYEKMMAEVDVFGALGETGGVGHDHSCLVVDVDGREMRMIGLGTDGKEWLGILRGEEGFFTLWKVS